MSSNLMANGMPRRLALDLLDLKIARSGLRARQRAMELS